MKYAANNHQAGALPPLKLDEESHPFRTRIRQTYDKGEPNFAGHYMIVSWGCGTACQSHALVDMKTGRARMLPITTSLGLLNRSDSRLLIVNPESLFYPTEIGQPDYTRPQFWVLQGDSLRSVPQSIVNTRDAF